MTDPVTLKPPPQAVLITGAGRRIGRAIAVDFGRRHWAVAVHHNRAQAEAAAVVEEIAAAGGRAVAIAADLSREDQAAALVDRVCAALGPLGCLVNNASRFDVDSPESATRESWEAHMEVNLRAPFTLTQAFAAQLPEDTRGDVINLIDQRVWSLTPYFTSYTVSKAGLWTLTRTMALALAPKVRVNAIGPGPTLPSERQTPERFAQQCRAVPLGHGASLDEICRTVRFILAAPSLTGQMIALDGGQHLAWAQGTVPE